MLQQEDENLSDEIAVDVNTNQVAADISINTPMQRLKTTRVRKLRTLSLSEKMVLLKEVEKGNRKKKDIAKEFGIPSSTLSTIYKNRDKLQEFAEVLDSGRKRMKQAKFPEVEEETLKWLSSVQNFNVPISGTLIREKAQWFAQVLGYEDFQASAGWLEKFRSRYLYIVKNLQKKAALANESDLQRWINGILPKIVKEYEERNIFCANETCLFHKCTLEKNKGDACDYFGEEQRNEWVTLLVATNMSGSEKLPLLVIGKSENPVCLSHIQSFAVQYKFEKQACMTPDLFAAWLAKLDEKFVKENRKIALIINDNTNHKKIKQNMKAVKVFLIPSNLTSHFQPLDHGIIKSFKYFFRKNMVLKFISTLNDSKKPKTSLLDCMRDVHVAWESISPSVISGSFRKAGFFKNNTGDITDFTAPLDDETILEEWTKLQEMSHIPTDMTFDSYVNIDENFMLLTSFSDNAIVNDLLHGDNDSQAEHEIAPQYIPSFSETFFAAENLRCFIESRQNVPSSVFQALAQIDQFLLKEKCNQEMLTIDNV